MKRHAFYSAALLTLATLCFSGCAAFNGPGTTPDKNDPAYHCHNEKGEIDATMTWCFPVDGTHTCCWDHEVCAPGNGCDYTGDPNILGAPRRPHHERVADDLVASNP